MMKKGRDGKNMEEGYFSVSSLWLPGQGRHGAVDLEEEERKRQEEKSALFQGSGFKPTET